MSDRASCRRALHDLLRAEYDCAGRLLSVLQAEGTALLGRNVDELESLVDEKNRLVARMEELDAEVQRVLKAHGHDSEPADIGACLRWCDDSGQLQRGWKSLMDRVASCEQQNRVNGATLDTTRRHAQQALNVLRGHVAGADLYNPTGLTAQSGAAGRSLAKA